MDPVEELFEIVESMIDDASRITYFDTVIAIFKVLNCIDGVAKTPEERRNLLNAAIEKYEADRDVAIKEMQEADEQMAQEMLDDFNEDKNDDERFIKEY